MPKPSKNAKTSAGKQDNIYKVEKILDKRTNKDGGVDYLVKWLGFPTNGNTWEPESNMFCHDMIEEFNRGDGANRKKRRGRSSRAKTVRFADESDEAAGSAASAAEEASDSPMEEQHQQPMETNDSDIEAELEIAAPKKSSGDESEAESERASIELGMNNYSDGLHELLMTHQPEDEEVDWIKKEVDFYEVELLAPPPSQVSCSDEEMEPLEEETSELKLSDATEWIGHYSKDGMNKTTIVFQPHVYPTDSNDSFSYSKSVVLAVKKEDIKMGMDWMAEKISFGEVAFEAGLTVLLAESGEETLGLLVSCNEEDESEMWRVDAKFKVELLGLSVNFDSYSFSKRESSIEMQFPMSIAELMGEGSKFIYGEGMMYLKMTIVVEDVEGYVLPREVDCTKRRRHDDAILEVQGTHLYVDSDLLSSQSSFFYELFHGEERCHDEPIVIENCPLDEFLLMLHLIYTYGKIDISSLIPVMRAAHLFQVVGLITKCHKFCYLHSKQLSFEQLVQAMQLSDQYEDAALEKIVLEVILERNLGASVMETEEYNGLSSDYKIFLLNSFVRREEEGTTDDDDERYARC